MLLALPRGSASVILHVFIADASSTTGAGLTGLTNASAGLAGRKLREGETLSAALTFEDITALGTYQAPSANTALRIRQVDAANMPGWYELHLHNDWVDATNGRRTLSFQLRGVANMAPLNVQLQLTDPISVSGGVIHANVKQWSDAAVAATDTAGYPKVTIKSGTGAGEIVLTSGRANADTVAISAHTTAADNLQSMLDGTGGVTLSAVLGNNAIPAASIATGAITNAKFASGAIDASAIAASALTAAKFATDAIDANALAAGAANEVRDAVFARSFSTAYNSHTFDELVKLMAAVLLGKASGLATTSATYRNLADNANAVVATVDADGNRSAVTRSP
jgi:hypothetical protein